VELPPEGPDGKVYVTTATAAKLLRVAPCTISTWRSKGYMEPMAGSPPRRPVYAWADVLEAEFRARQNAIRTSGTDAQVRRDREVPDDE